MHHMLHAMTPPVRPCKLGSVRLSRPIALFVPFVLSLALALARPPATFGQTPPAKTPRTTTPAPKAAPAPPPTQTAPQTPPTPDAPAILNTCEYVDPQDAATLLGPDASATTAPSKGALLSCGYT